MANDITRRRFLKMLGLGTLSAPFASSLFAKSLTAADDTYTCYIGTYTDGDSKGIYRCTFNAQSGELAIDEATSGIVNPSFLALSLDRRYLYAVSETSTYKDQPGGSVQAFAIDPDSGSLNYINEQPSNGSAPCHLRVDHRGKNLLVANYMGGNFEVLPIGEDGSLGEKTALVQHHGSGPNKDRQEAPHGHFITPDPNGRFVLTVDLGTDKVIAYPYNADKGTLDTENAVPTELDPGSGPRHLAFHPNGRWVYVISELKSTMTVFDYNPKTGELKRRQTITTLPDDFNEHNQTAEVHVSDDGQFVYGSNRGHNSLVVYRVNTETGKLRTVQHQSTLGNWPRYFGIDPTGNYILVANRRTNNVVVFNRDKESGKIDPAGSKLEVPAPVCIAFWEKGQD